MAHPRRFPWPAAAAAALLTTGLALGTGASPASAASSVSAVVGSALGYHSFNITLFGGAQSDVGPTPTVALASDASNSPQTASVPSGLVQYGPAVLFTSDTITLDTTGSLGTTGSVTSTSSVADINRSTQQPTLTGSEVLSADTISGSCSASTSATTGSTTITNGTMQTSSSTTVTLPTNPAPNTTISGSLTANGSTDKFHYVFNEQTTNTAGTLTVNPVDEYFDGPTLKGNLIIGQVVCGATVSNSPPVANADSYTTPFNTQLSVPAPGVLANDSDPDGDTLTASLATGASNGTLALNADGSFTYTPNSGFTGSDSFTYSVSDGFGNTAGATVTITVTAPSSTDLSLQNPPISASSNPVPAGATVTFTVTVSNFGPNDAPAVVDVTSLTGARFGGATSSAGTCSVSKGKSKVVTCDLGTIANGGSATVTITATAPHKAGGTITVSSTVSSAATDPNTGNNTDSLTVSVQ